MPRAPDSYLRVRPPFRGMGFAAASSAASVRCARRLRRRWEPRRASAELLGCLLVRSHTFATRRGGRRVPRNAEHPLQILFRKNRFEGDTNTGTKRSSIHGKEKRERRICRARTAAQRGGARETSPPGQRARASPGRHALGPADNALPHIRHEPR